MRPMSSYPPGSTLLNVDFDPHGRMRQRDGWSGLRPTHAYIGASGTSIAGPARVRAAAPLWGGQAERLRERGTRS